MADTTSRTFRVETPKYLFLVFVSFFVFFPLYLMVNISLKNSGQIAKNPWFPHPAVETVKILAPEAGVFSYGPGGISITGPEGSRTYDVPFTTVFSLEWERGDDLRVPEKVDSDEVVATLRLTSDARLRLRDGILFREDGGALVLPGGFTPVYRGSADGEKVKAGTVLGELRAPFAGTVSSTGGTASFVSTETGARIPLADRYGLAVDDVPVNAVVQAAPGTLLPAGALAFTCARRVTFKWQNYIEAYRYVLPYVTNTVLIAVSVVVLSLLFSSLSAYAFSRYDFYGKNVLFGMIVVLMMIPGVLNLVPMFVIVKNFPLFGGNDIFGNGGYGLLDNHLAVILPAVAGSQIMNIYILRNFFEGLPEGLFESGRIDGATDLQMYWHICLPLSRPIMGTLAIMAIVAQWNNYLWPLVTLKKESLFTITIGLAHLEGQFASDYGLQMAGFTIAAVPLVLLFMFTMKLFIRGLSSGAIKF